MNPDPSRGLSSSVQLGIGALSSTADAALIVLGDQPDVPLAAIRALLDAPDDPERPIVVPRYADDDARNPVLLGRPAFPLAATASGDRGLGPVLAAHPELVREFAVAGPRATPTSTPGRTSSPALEAAWAERVGANNAQVDRHREVPDGTDFYAPVNGLFRADLTRTDEPVLQELLMLAQPGETWLDIGAGAGRYALPLALELGRGGGSVVAVDPSRGMLDALRATADEHAVTNVRIVEGRWPDVAPEAGQGRGQPHRPRLV